ncbi:MAG: MBL fold metallo-hydrolase [bacterium]|nr:MBL fold metallo-hydrolase [bacterium]
MLKFLKRFFIGLFAIILILVLSVTLFVNFAPAFGDDPSGAYLEQIKKSEHHNGEHFVNLVETRVDTSDPEKGMDIMGALYEFFNPPIGKNPSEPLPSEKFSPANFKNGSFVWFGHSTVLMRFNDINILADPVFFNASPIPGTAKPFEMQKQNEIEDLPEIDVVIISHDHYDHLDYQAIQKLDEKVDKYLVPLGIKAHLLKWDVDEEKITEMEWYEETTIDDVLFAMTPSRHFSGRGLTNRFSTLWCSWVIQSDNDSTNVFFSGDSGYFTEFQKIGEKYGPFDIAFMENGAYNTDWSQIHFLPGENVQAAIDLKAKSMFAIHWGKFDLARHKWTEPIVLADSISAVRNVPLITPLVGEVFTLQNAPKKKWWTQSL